MDIVLPLHEMTVAEKLRAMEVLWDDLSRNPDDIPTPAWHAEVLAARQKEIDEGRAKFIPWEECRESLHKEIR